MGREVTSIQGGCRKNSGTIFRQNGRRHSPSVMIVYHREFMKLQSIFAATMALAWIATAVIAAPSPDRVVLAMEPEMDLKLIKGQGAEVSVTRRGESALLQVRAG